MYTLIKQHTVTGETSTQNFSSAKELREHLYAMWIYTQYEIIAVVLNGQQIPHSNPVSSEEELLNRLNDAKDVIWNQAKVCKEHQLYGVQGMLEALWNRLDASLYSNKVLVTES